MKYKEFVASLDQLAIVEAIKRAERRCSGEIRVHVQPKSWGGEIRQVAQKTFERLGMTKTAQRNGILLFIATDDQRFVILGDQGIHERVGADFWEKVVMRIGERFKLSQFNEGIIEAIDDAGSLLALHFPFEKSDVDELSDEISFSDEEGPYEE